MKILISGVHLAKFPELRAYATRKVERLENYFPNFVKVEVRLIWEKAHRNDLHSSACAIVADIPGTNLKILERDEAMDKAIDRAVERMHRLLVKTKEKKISKKHKEGLAAKAKK
ncbi:ribosome-associated translation inhibitor RaiA [Candidatus Curtissbacteria bacterium]|nr:ribosome-associated translation inhibitor RaiA [Candidatus Curtissbacteria bacterium]